jgi:hypothetical protein
MCDHRGLLRFLFFFPSTLRVLEKKNRNKPLWCDLPNTGQYELVISKSEKKTFYMYMFCDTLMCNGECTPAVGSLK